MDVVGGREGASLSQWSGTSSNLDSYFPFFTVP